MFKHHANNNNQNKVKVKDKKVNGTGELLS